MKTERYGTLVLASLSITFVLAQLAGAEEASKFRVVKNPAVEACFAEAGVSKPEKGKRGPPPKMTEDQREKLHACFKKNGIEPPPHPPEGRRPPPPRGDEGPPPIGNDDPVAQ